MSHLIDPATLTRDLGGKWHHNYGTAPCPVCQPERRQDQNALGIAAKGDKLLLHCKKCDCSFCDILTAAGIAPGHREPDRVAIEAANGERRAQKAKARKRARSIWEQAKPICGTHGETYLHARGITCALPETLRWLGDAYHTPSGKFCGAMVADVAPTGGIHRTFFTKQGQRLEKSAKMMMGPCSGGAVHLSNSRGPLVVCEGLETGLSLLSGLLIGSHAVCAALSTSGIKGFVLPDHPDNLIVATDGDMAGREAGYALAHRATASGWKVSLLPAPDGQDWNDVLRSGVVT